MNIVGHPSKVKTEVELQRKDGDAVAEHEFDPVAFDAAIAKWRGTATERMKRLGFNSTDEFIDAIRGR